MRIPTTGKPTSSGRKTGRPTPTCRRTAGSRHQREHGPTSPGAQLPGEDSKRRKKQESISDRVDPPGSAGVLICEVVPVR